ncbi:MAG: hypothetical protein Q4A98_07780 [Comamonadaceae bacterium]|nr:hypothetical protein [Comamonadaceae bacterium]
MRAPGALPDLGLGPGLVTTFAPVRHRPIPDQTQKNHPVSAYSSIRRFSFGMEFQITNQRKIRFSAIKPKQGDFVSF